MGARKIYTLQQLSSRLEHDRKIIFTHGSFDLFHIGHLSLLKKSKELGGKLIVGIDHDESVQYYKKRRTVFSFNHRLDIISQIGCVDYVLSLPKLCHPSDFDYFFLQLYLTLRPNIVTFGTNFWFGDTVSFKCRLAGIEARQIQHAYSELSTTGYITDILKRNKSGETGFRS